MTDRTRSSAGYFLIYIALVVTHSWLLRLPYFWDEAGYYIPAAHDFFLHGNLIPTATLTNAHPPLPSIYLVIWWKMLGFSPVVTRLAMLFVAAFALLQVFLLARRVANREVAIAATLLTAVYPVFFAQSSLAHADLPAMAFTLLGLRLYLDDERWRCAMAFAAAALAKETAVLIPAVLLFWEVFDRLSRKTPIQWGRFRWITLSFVPLAAWYVYHYLRTGFVFGNPEFVRYNLATTIHPLRFALALWQRTWQVFGHMNMWVLTAMTGAAMLLPPLPVSASEVARQRDNGQDTGGIRPRIAIATQFLFAMLIVAHIAAYSLVGGALLSRYLLPMIPLVIIIGVSTLWRRVREWRWLLGFVCLVFIVGWFVNPPYRFAPEDNLNYADFIRLHQHAIDFISDNIPGRKFSGEQMLTAWPAMDELRKPDLGYVPKPPLRVVAIENFTFEQIMLAQQSPAYDSVFAFSTKYEPQVSFLRWAWWEKQNVRFFDYHRDLPPEAIARMLGGTIVMQESRNGQWVAVIEMPRTRNAALR